MDVKVETRGVAQLNKALKQLDAGLGTELKTGFTEIAEDVANTARGSVPRRSGRAAASIKARGSARGGSIAFGGSAAPYYPWLDFGGSVGRGHMQGKAGSGSIKRPTVKDGRYIYPTIASKSDAIKEGTDKLLERLAERAGFDTRGKA